MKKWWLFIPVCLLLLAVCAAAPAKGETVQTGGHPSEAPLVAVLDTGVDADHPDLRGYLVPGFNLVDPEQPPEDRNGHGTATAGVLVDVHKRMQAKARIMPVKVMGDDGTGEAKRISQGIRLAVNKGAKIILLSLSTPIYSTELEQAAAYAEEKGVLLIAATGNDAERVTYPAAFPTVLSVGAVDGDRKVAGFSNRGPELDLVAPGVNLLTTYKQNGYTHFSGTSMAAPQAAGIASLILQKNPGLTPLQVRMLLQATAEDLGPKGWDRDSGYGLLDGRKALERAMEPSADHYEPNDTADQAAPLSVITETEARLDPRDAVDWYRMDVPYDGEVQVKLTAGGQAGVTAELLDRRLKKVAAGSGVVRVTVSRGTVYLKIAAAVPTGQMLYRLETSFSMKEDAYEPNDTKGEALKLPADELVRVRGNFHRMQDVDWYMADYPSEGTVSLELLTDTVRMDPVLMIWQEGVCKQEIDNGSMENGQKEQGSGAIRPGRVYYAVRDFYGNRVDGEYELVIRYAPGALAGDKK